MPSSHRIKSLRRQAFKRQGGLCCYCGARMWLSSPDELPCPLPSSAAARLKCTAEHLVPRSEGGTNTPANIVAACAHCNHTRHKRNVPPSPSVYRQQVTKRVQAGSWHYRWMHAAGLIGAAPALMPIMRA